VQAIRRLAERPRVGGVPKQLPSTNKPEQTGKNPKRQQSGLSNGGKLASWRCAKSNCVAGLGLA